MQSARGQAAHAKMTRASFTRCTLRLVVPDDLINQETQKLFGKGRVKLSFRSKRPQATNLPSLPIRISGRQTRLGLIGTDFLGDLEPLGQHVNDSGIDVVD
jgi:hypothetical protein